MVIILTSFRKENDSNKFKNRQWIVKKKDLLELLQGVRAEIDFVQLLVKEQEKLLLKNGEGVLCEKIKYVKQSKDDVLTLTLQILN